MGDQEDCEVDGDTFTEPINTVFNTTFEARSKIKISEGCYILSLDVSEKKDTIVTALSDYKIGIYDYETMDLTRTYRGHSGALCRVSFDSKDPNAVFSGSQDGSVKMWDLRSSSEDCARKFVDASADGVVKPILDFGINAAGRFLCAGTETVVEDAFLMFWDIRAGDLLGGYWESHSNDITSVRFHDIKPNRLLTGSTDGLLNIFDVSKSNESEALVHTLNVDNSVNQARWFQDEGEDLIACFSCDEELQVWNTEGTSPEAVFDREAVTRATRRKISDDCYLVDGSWDSSTKKFYVVTGSATPGSSCLRVLVKRKNKLRPHAALLNEDLDGVIRAAHFVRAADEKDIQIVTGGEDSTLRIWTQYKDERSDPHKMKSKLGSKIKPLPY